jgi:hypothetical protein
MILRLETQALLTEMETMPFFSTMGTNDGSVYEQVEPFEEAVELLRYDPWVALVHEEGNKIRDRVRTISWDRCNEWNKHVALSKPEKMAIIENKVDAKEFTNEVKQLLKDEMNYVFGFRLIELQYSDIIESSFFDGAVDVYRQGFIPCGWAGEHLPPMGRFVAF